MVNLPSSFVDYTRSLLGEEEYRKLSAALQEAPPVSIRLNRLKVTDEVLGSRSCEAVPWSSEGFYLDRRLTFTFDPLFHAGCYYVQEASSMFLEQALRQYVSSPVVMLDLCASPGGKATHARSLLPKGSLLVANEVMRNRVQALTGNIVKLGHQDVVVTNNSPADFSALPAFFDVILVDAPCSGEGMFRKDPIAVEEWSRANVEVCWQRQRRILSDVWSSLKAGGLIIYSTCTYNVKENEENVRWIRDELGADVLPLKVDKGWNLTGDLSGGELPVYRFLPHKTRGEGFFMAVLRKWVAGKGEKKATKNSLKPKPSFSVSKGHSALVNSWLNNEFAEHYLLQSDGERLTAFPQQYSGEWAMLKQHLKVISAGVCIGEVKGKELMPAHALAMSPSLLHQAAFPTEEIDYNRAIAYLRKETVCLSETTPRGYVLLLYRGIPLGFVKNIGNRANNLYPPEWRIRSGYLPDKVSTL